MLRGPAAGLHYDRVLLWSVPAYAITGEPGYFDSEAGKIPSNFKFNPKDRAEQTGDQGPSFPVVNTVFVLHWFIFFKLFLEIPYRQQAVEKITAVFHPER